MASAYIAPEAGHAWNSPASHNSLLYPLNNQQGGDTTTTTTTTTATSTNRNLSVSSAGTSSTSTASTIDSDNHSSNSSDGHTLHAHRQNHNSSKLPAFRFADLKNKDSLVLPTLLQHNTPPSPLSPSPSSSPNPHPQASPDLPVVVAHKQQGREPPDPRNTPSRSQQIAGCSPPQNNPPSSPHPAKTANKTATSTVSPAHKPSSSPTTATPGNNNNNNSSSGNKNNANHNNDTITTFSSPTRNRASTVQDRSPSTSFTPSRTTKRPASLPEPSPSRADAAQQQDEEVLSPIRLSSSSTTTTAAASSGALSSSSSSSHQKRRRPHASSSPEFDGTSSSSHAAVSSSLNRHRSSRGADRHAHSSSAAEIGTKDWAQGQRELLLPKTLESGKSSSDDRRRPRPPVSFRQPAAAAAAAATAARSPVIPPIRSFRSSGSRKSLVLDMQSSRRTSYDSGDDAGDSNHRDRTLRALEGRAAPDDDLSRITPPDSAEAAPDDNNTADIFMKLAREDPAHRSAGSNGSAEDRSAVSRIVRSTQPRPVSAAIPSYHATSPPRITRRLSDQRENSRSRHVGDDSSLRQSTRELSYRAISKDHHSSPVAQSSEDPSRSAVTRAPLRALPLTPRSLTFHETSSDVGLLYSRRRPSLTESTSGASSSSRAPQYRSANAAAYGQGRTYNSSPLVPRSAAAAEQPQNRYDAHHHHQHHQQQQHHQHHHAAQHSGDAGHGGVAEGTESSASTAAASTVWDELDELKSRIHRLELTGKAPSTSGAAMSRVSDERPPTATTNATTMSASPKRVSGPGGAGAGQTADAVSTTTSSSHKDGQQHQQPILLSALSKTKGYVSSDVFVAIESAAAEAMALASMIGAAGQPGPISSGASTIGSGSGGTVTDRQLRRKAESICRSLTELCLALTDAQATTTTTTTTTTPHHHHHPPRAVADTSGQREKETVTSPTASVAANTHNNSSHTTTTTATTNNNNNTNAGSTPSHGSQRRPTALMDPALSRLNPSPRTGSSFEHRRSALLGSTTALPSPRFAALPGTPTTDVGRRSSLLIARTRRAGTEEPEEATTTTGRRSSLLLRSRRAATEEPEEGAGRKSSLLQTRRAAAAATNLEGGDEEEEGGGGASRLLRAPSRAVTEVAALRMAAPRASYGQAVPAGGGVAATASEAGALASSALPRRRFVSSTLALSPLSSLSSSRNGGPVEPGSRRYLDRSTPERDGASGVAAVGGPAEDRGSQRQFSLSQAAVLNRTGSLGQRQRESAIPSLSSAASHVGTYR